MRSPEKENRIWTVPNGVCAFRLAGVAPLLWTAQQGHRTAFLWILVALLLSDWVDGKLAILLDQRTVVGARLDSAADGLLYLAVALSFWWLEKAVVRAHAPWILGALGSWIVSAAVTLIRFHRLPSYHTWTAKSSWFLLGGATLLLLVTRNALLLPWALGLVILSNLEDVAIGLALPRWQADVRSLPRAWRRRREEREEKP